jgi:excisionase family DNA binding protein
MNDLVVISRADLESLLEQVLDRRIPELLSRKQEKLYTTEEAAVYLRCHPKSIRRWKSSGRLKGRKAGSKTLYTQEELDEIFPK